MTKLQTVKRQALINGFELKTHQGEYTRKTASILSTLSLIQKQQTLTSQSIDNECFELFYFTLSNNKSQGSTKSNLLKRRLPKYLDNQLFKYSAITDLVELSNQGKAQLLKDVRQRVTVNDISKAVKRVHAEKLKALKAKCSFKGRKSIVTKADNKKVSKMLLNHLKVA